MFREPDARGLSSGRAVRKEPRTRGTGHLWNLKHLLLLPLASIVFTAAGSVMVAEAIADRDVGAFGVALMGLGLGVGTIGMTVVDTLEYCEVRAARRAATSTSAPSSSAASQAAQFPAGLDSGVRRRRPAAERRRSGARWFALVAIPALLGVTCVAVGAGFMLFGYGPGQQVGGGAKSAPAWLIAGLVWGGLAALGIMAIVRHVRIRRTRRR